MKHEDIARTKFGMFIAHLASQDEEFDGVFDCVNYAGEAVIVPVLGSDTVHFAMDLVRRGGGGCLASRPPHNRVEPGDLDRQGHSLRDAS